MDIIRAGTRPSGKGPSDWFSGTVRIDPLFNPHAPERVQGASVTFEPGARTAWHTHPLGQTLIVTAGFGRVQRWGGPVEEIRPGDVVWFPPGEKHWHGAGPASAALVNSENYSPSSTAAPPRRGRAEPDCGCWTAGFPGPRPRYPSSRVPGRSRFSIWGGGGTGSRSNTTAITTARTGASTSRTSHA